MVSMIIEENPRLALIPFALVALGMGFLFLGDKVF